MCQQCTSCAYYAWQPLVGTNAHKRWTHQLRASCASGTPTVRVSLLVRRVARQFEEGRSVASRVGAHIVVSKPWLRLSRPDCSFLMYTIVHRDAGALSWNVLDLTAAATEPCRCLRKRQLWTLFKVSCTPPRRRRR